MDASTLQKKVLRITSRNENTMVKILVYRNFITLAVPLTEGCSGYSRFTRPWTEYLYGKLLANAGTGVGEDYRKENSMITKANGSIS